MCGKPKNKPKPGKGIDVKVNEKEEATNKISFWNNVYCREVRLCVDYMKKTLKESRGELRKAARQSSKLLAFMQSASDELTRAVENVHAPAATINEMVDDMKRDFAAAAAAKRAEFIADLDAATKRAAARILAEAIKGVEVKGKTSTKTTQ